MIKLTCGMSKKIPAETPYSSRQFHASLEVEVADDVASDGEKLQGRLRALWNDLEDAVEAQIERSNGNGTTPRSDSGYDSGDQPHQPATQKQISFLGLLAKRAKGWGLPELEKHIRQRFGNVGLYQLSKDQASALIEELQSLQSQGNSGKRARR